MATRPETPLDEGGVPNISPLRGHRPLVPRQHDVCSPSGARLALEQYLLDWLLRPSVVAAVDRRNDGAMHPSLYPVVEKRLVVQRERPSPRVGPSASRVPTYHEEASLVSAQSAVHPHGQR